MKNIGLLLIGLITLSCNQSKKESQEINIKSTTSIETTKNFNWLLGKWQRLNEEEGKDTFENWEKINNTEYAGIGFTMQNGDTIQQEKITLKKENKKWNLIVKAPEETEPTTFKGANFNENEFTCENNEIEFPNKIRYWKNGYKLNATVSADDFEINFEFEKLK
jgi:hypothetical protein